MTCKSFEHWGNYRDGTFSRAAFVRRMPAVRREVKRLLLRGVQSGNPSLVGMCQELYEHRARLWTFVRQEGVEPTNNAATSSTILPLPSIPISPSNPPPHFYPACERLPAASLAEGMKESTPQPARVAMEKILKLEMDPALRKRLETLLSKMPNQGN